MDWQLALQAIETIAVTVGVVFGLIQLRHFHHERELQAAVQLVQSMHDREWASGA